MRRKILIGAVELISQSGAVNFGGAVVKLRKMQKVASLVSMKAKLKMKMKLIPMISYRQN